VAVGVLVGVSVGVLVGVTVGVFVAVLVGVFVGVSVGVGVGVRTFTVSKLVLLLSLPSGTLLFGSTVTLLGRLTANVGVTLNVILKDAPVGRVTTPLAMQFKAVPAIEQLIVPVGGIAPFVTVNTPCG
jgi:choline-glycine betaine transporter